MKNFEEIINSEEKVLVKFGADWCGPCKIMDKALGGLIAEGIPNIYKINVEEFPEIAGKYAIRNLPTTMIFQNGLLVDRFSGLATASQIKEKLK